MKNVSRAIATVMVVGLLAGCASSEYIISTTSGVMITTRGKPSLDEKTGIYTYKDDEGRKATIKKDDVKQVMER
jgi:hypothetical protein